jgi:hypothetical protein
MTRPLLLVALSLFVVQHANAAKDCEELKSEIAA